MIRRALEWVGGSVLVYVLVAACAGADDGNGLPSTEGENPTGEGEAATSQAGSAQGSNGGSVINPVPPVNAQSGGEPGDGDDSCSCPTPPEPKTVSVSCQAMGYAVLSLPGASTAQLSAIDVVNTNLGGPDGEYLGSSGFWLKDGSIAVYCPETGDVVFQVPGHLGHFLEE